MAAGCYNFDRRCHEIGITDGEDHGIRTFSAGPGFRVFHPVLRCDGLFGAEGKRQIAAYFERFDDKNADADTRRLGDDFETHHAAGDDDKALSGDELGLVMHGVETVGQGLDEDRTLMRQIVGIRKGPRDHAIGLTGMSAKSA